MIKISRNTANAVALTLTEKRVTLSHTTYLLQFVKHDTEQTIYCICSDTSNYPDRYNLLTVTEVAANADPLAGEVTMTDGRWDYFAFDNNNSATNLDPTNLLLLERGFVTVVVAGSQPATFTGGNNTYTVF